MILGMIGCGRMGSALLRGILSNTDAVERALVHDTMTASAQSLADDLEKVEAIGSNLAVAESADVILLCVKPQGIVTACQEIANSRPSLCISVAAGVTISMLESSLGDAQRVIRVMPNTPALVGAGATGFSLGNRATEDDAALAKTLLGSVGIAHEVPESLLDAVTGLSGSGPAYIYQVIEALSDGGVYNGLPRPVATELAAQTVLGAAKMVLETKAHPGELKDQVTSPGGTTIRGIAALEEAGLRNAIISAVNASAEHSARMSQNT